MCTPIFEPRSAVRQYHCRTEFELNIPDCGFLEKPRPQLQRGNLLWARLTLGLLAAFLCPALFAAQTLDDMYVVGIVTGHDAIADYALISQRNNEPEIYHKGDQIVPGIILEQIFTDRIRAKSGSSIVEIKLGSPFAGDTSDYPSSPSPTMDYATAPEPPPMEPEPPPVPELSQEMAPPDAPMPPGQDNPEPEQIAAPEPEAEQRPAHD